MAKTPRAEWADSLALGRPGVLLTITWPNFNSRMIKLLSSIVEVSEWISSLIHKPDFMIYGIIYPCWYQIWLMLIKWNRGMYCPKLTHTCHDEIKIVAPTSTWSLTESSRWCDRGTSTCWLNCTKIINCGLYCEERLSTLIRVIQLQWCSALLLIIHWDHFVQL